MHHLAVLSFFVVGSVCLHDVHASRDCAIMMQAGQGGQVELEGVVSSRAAARTTESKPEEEQPKKRTSRRRLQRGSAAFEGDQLAKSVMEQTIKSDEAGNAYINRATFGNGEMQWYGIGVRDSEEWVEGASLNTACICASPAYKRLPFPVKAPSDLSSTSKDEFIHA
eukprot:scaffold143599_cov21-Tisochrysis_lutea.AAC.2